MYGFLIIISLLIVILFLEVRTRPPLLQYLVFVRIPLFTGLFLLLFPLIAPSSVLLRGMLVFESADTFFFVSLISFLAGALTVQSGLSIIENAPERFGVRPLLGSKEGRVVETRALPVQVSSPAWEHTPKWELIEIGLTLLFSLPMLVGSWLLSPEPSILGKAGYTAFGLAASVLIAIAVVRVRRRIRKIHWNGAFAQWLLNKGRDVSAGYLEPRQDGISLNGKHPLMATIAFALLGFYLVGLFWLRPPHHATPALFYLVFLALMLNFILSGVTFFLDRFRVPIIFTLVALSFSLSRLEDFDHFFKLFPAEPGVRNSQLEVLTAKLRFSKEAWVHQDEIPPKSVMTEEEKQAALVHAWRAQATDLAREEFLRALRARLKDQAGDRVLVVVCASGGGIQSAGWTTQVLTRLHAHRDFGPDFIQSIGLLSTVSGGSVGGLYFLDRLEALQAAPDEATAERLRREIRTGSTGNSLPATAWGLAFPDFLRVMGLGFLIPNEFIDRGWALEQAFKSRLDERHRDARLLADWRPAILEGRLPTPVFNATIVESGERFLLTPMYFPFSRQARYLIEYYPGRDIETVSAARLSATFPYVTPSARARFEGDGAQAHGVHMADGAYFDNFGIFVALEWLERVVLPGNPLELDRIIILEINAFSEDIPVAEGHSGWRAAWASPLDVLTIALLSTQVSRNRAEIESLRSRWLSQKMDIAYFVMRFRLDAEDAGCPEGVPCPAADGPELAPDYEPPLSWKLTARESQALCRAWNTLVCGGYLNPLRNYWRGEPY